MPEIVMNFDDKVRDGEKVEAVEKGAELRMQLGWMKNHRFGGSMERGSESVVLGRGLKLEGGAVELGGNAGNGGVGVNLNRYEIGWRR